MIFDRYATLKYKHGKFAFWGRGYNVDTVERDKTAGAEYIKNQLGGRPFGRPNIFQGVRNPFTGSQNITA